MPRPLAVAWLYIRIGAMNELQYRANFIVALFQALLALAVALVVLSLVYAHTTELNGWTEPQLLCLLGIQILMGGVINAVIQPNMERLMEEIGISETRRLQGLGEQQRRKLFEKLVP